MLSTHLSSLIFLDPPLPAVQIINYVNKAILSATIQSKKERAKIKVHVLKLGIAPSINCAFKLASLAINS